MSKGWSWHWAQRMRRPRKRWAVSSAWTVGLDRIHGIVDRSAFFDVGGVSHRGQERPDDLVPRLILFQTTIDTGLVAIRSVILSGRADLKQVPQLDPPEADEFGTGEQAVDEFDALVGVLIGEEAADLDGGRLFAGEIERDAAEERRVAGRRAGGNLERLEPLEQLVIDEVAPLDLGEIEGEPGVDDCGQPRAQDERLVANDHIGFGAA